jgi:hypothetical protein
LSEHGLSELAPQGRVDPVTQMPDAQVEKSGTAARAVGARPLGSSHSS